MADPGGPAGVELEDHYRELLRELGSGTGLIPTIFRKAQSRITDPAKLERLVSLIDKENWSGLDIDTKAEIYEGLLEKNAQINNFIRGRHITIRRDYLGCGSGVKELCERGYLY